MLPLFASIRNLFGGGIRSDLVGISIKRIPNETRVCNDNSEPDISNSVMWLESNVPIQSKIIRERNMIHHSVSEKLVANICVVEVEVPPQKNDTRIRIVFW